MRFLIHAMSFFFFLLIIFFFAEPQLTCSSSSLPSSKGALCPPDQRLSLLQFKDNLYINSSTPSEECSESYPKTDNWKEGVNCCLWDGVTCDDDSGNIVGLDLSCSWIRGTIYSNSSLFNLSHLRRLNLADNNFETSPISPMFGRFPSLKHLNLSSSGFSGKLQFDLSCLSQLVSLDLSHNDIYIESFIFKGLIKNLTHLTQLRLVEVHMGSVPPNLLMNLSSALVYLSLIDVGLQGNFPSIIFHFPNLQHLDLSNNHGLIGSLPQSNMTTLKFLDLSDCSFTGFLPMSMGNLTQITHIYLSNNKFSGEIPPFMSNLAQLQFLSLSNNNFEGRIPDVFKKLEKLTDIFLYGNRLSGQLPSTIFNLTQVSYLDFSRNELSGAFPEFATGLSKLVRLDLYDNILNGTIPPCFLSLPSLESLNLENNVLMGNVSKFNFSFSLRSVRFSFNKLYGPFPKSIFELENLDSLGLSTNNLSGGVSLDSFSKLKNLKNLDLSNSGLLLLNSTNFRLPNLTYLNLSSCNLKEFPRGLEASKNIESLDLSNNKIHGKVPKWLYEVGVDSLTYLDLSNNNLTKILHFPWENIVILNLDGNLLEGNLPIPPSGTQFFSISKNKFTGKIPSTICHLSNLRVLILSHNNLTGKLPHCLGNFSQLLTDLDLRMNSFEGTLPEVFGNNLRSLNLNRNQFGGSLPRSLLNCTNLQFLDFGNNNICDIFPDWLGTLPELQVLVLRSNNFYGSVRGSKMSKLFPMLKIFDLSRNKFSGPFPAEYVHNFQAMRNISAPESGMQYIGDEYTYWDSLVLTMKGQDIELVRILTILINIDLSHNGFEGKIPEVIGELKSLKGLILSCNNFTGRIPESIGFLTNLEWLDLSSNNLSGEIPKEMSNLTFLSFLNLSHNNLVGRIPKGNQLNTFGIDSYKGNSRLCGFPLTKKCGYEDGSQSPPSFPQQNEMEHESMFNWKAAPLGYATGIVYGVGLGYFFLFRRRRA